MTQTKILAGLEAIAVGVVSFTLLLALTGPILPLVMQDELIYRSQSFADSFRGLEYPTYLFTAASRLAEASELPYYLVVKATNSGVAAIASSALFLVAAQIFSRKAAYLSTLVFLVTPSSLQASLYMPDMFLSAFSLIGLTLIMLALHENRSSGSWTWWIAALALALALLSKPHALIILFALVVFGVWNSLANKKISPVFGVVSAALVLRLLVGLLFAGLDGLNLFGPSYSNTFLNLSYLAPESLTASADQLAIANGAKAQVGGDAILLGFTMEFAQLFLALGLFSFGLIVPTIVRMNRDSNSRLVTTLVVFSTLGIALFETFIGLAGDDHSDRVLTRHIEFLLPLIVAVGLSSLAKLREQSKVVFLASMLATSFVAASAVIVLLEPSPEKIADGTLMELSGLWDGGFLVAIALLTALLWATRLTRFDFTLSVAVGYLLVSAVGLWGLRHEYSTNTTVDDLGVLVEAQPWEGERVLVVTDSRRQGELLRFYLLPVRTEQRVVEPGAQVRVGERHTILLPVGRVSITTNCTQGESDQFIVYECEGSGGRN